MKTLRIAMVSLVALGIGASAGAVQAADNDMSKDAISNPAAWWLGRMDVDRDGRLTYDEFSAGRERQFASLDLNDDNVVTVDERQTAVNKWNERHPSAKIDYDMSEGDMDEADFQAETAVLFKRLDMDSNNEITPSEVEAAHDNGQLTRTMEGDEDADASEPPAHGATGSTISPEALKD